MILMLKIIVGIICFMIGFRIGEIEKEINKFDYNKFEEKMQKERKHDSR